MKADRFTFRFWNRVLRKTSKPMGLGVSYEHLCEEWGVFNWPDIDKMQSTGRLDKTGVEIFEGCRVSWTHEIFNNGKTITGVVKWHDDSAGFYIEQDDTPYDPDIIGFYGEDALFVWEDLEIIGNVHDKEETG